MDQRTPHDLQRRAVALAFGWQERALTGLSDADYNFVREHALRFRSSWTADDVRGDFWEPKAMALAAVPEPERNSYLESVDPDTSAALRYRSDIIAAEARYVLARAPSEARAALSRAGLYPVSSGSQTVPETETPV